MAGQGHGRRHRSRGGRRGDAREAGRPRLRRWWRGHPGHGRPSRSQGPHRYLRDLEAGPRAAPGRARRRGGGPAPEGRGREPAHDRRLGDPRPQPSSRSAATGRASRRSRRSSRSTPCVPSRTWPWPRSTPSRASSTRPRSTRRSRPGKEPGKAFEILAQIMMDEKRPEGGGGLRAAQPRRRPPADDEPLHPRAWWPAQEGQLRGALASFRAAAEAKARQKGMLFRGLHFQTGDCLARLGREAEAEKEFLAELDEPARVDRGPRGPGHALPFAGPGRAGPRGAGGPRGGGEGADRPRPTGRSCAPSRCWATSRRLGPGPARRGPGSPPTAASARPPFPTPYDWSPNP